NRMTVTSGEVSGEDIDVTQSRGGVYPRPNPLDGNHFISHGPHILICFAGEGGDKPRPYGMEWLNSYSYIQYC
ncbi:MAG: hypothetical protein SPL37_03915, partial [Prevotella sp.]|nr:hypothetical protein [Prevotella sp.]